MLEKEILKAVLNKLSSWQCDGDIIWHTRLNSGNVETIRRTWLKLCDKGTPDIIAICRNCKNELIVVFIETKRKNKKKLDPEQELFRKKLLGHTDIFYLVINDVQDLINNINNIIYDRIQGIIL